MVVILATLFLPKNIYGQVQFGIQVGINNSNVSWKDIETEAIKGFNAGAIIAFGINNNFALETGLKYSQKGYYNGYYVYEYLGYLDVPVQFKYSYNITDSWKLSVFAGGYIALGLNYKAVDDLNNATYNYNWAESNYNRLDYGPIVGMGARYKHIQLSVDYQFGLANMNETLGKLNNRTIGLSLAYYFGKNN